ncbi:MAG TPA: DUF4255 domain-containing protein [Jatrophihabitans sp.]|nr:DUF4255 domain-containing protein [Jatrophihabitans sp.]
MFIRRVDESLDRMLRAELPLPIEVADVSFDAPTPGWAAGVSRPTVSLFLYEVLPSRRPAQAVGLRVDAAGQVQRRRALPMVDLNYLVSAWAATSLEEHDLLGRLASFFAGQGSVPAAHLPDDSIGDLQLFFGGDDRNQLRDIWRAAGGELKGSFTVSLVVAADSAGWYDEAPPVARVVGSVARRAE